MTQPSDETFLDEMAETLRAVESDNGVYPALVVSVPDFLRLVALARRAPALTCGTCRYNLIEREDWGIVSCCIMADVDFREAHPDIKGHWECTSRPMFNPDGTRHGCSLHAPAPPEARP